MRAGRELREQEDLRALGVFEAPFVSRDLAKGNACVGTLASPRPPLATPAQLSEVKRAF